jgi:hypothetical protein
MNLRDFGDDKIMDKLRELTEYLGRAYGADIWSDFAVDGATDLLDQLGAEQWDELSSAWNSKDVKWQVRLCQALGTCQSPRALDLLLTMLRSDVLEVAVAAAESLESKDDVWAPDSSMRNLLQDLHDRAAEKDKYIFAILLAKISD